LGVDPKIDLRQHLADRWDMSREAKPLADLEWLGLFSDDPLPSGAETPIDILTARMQAKMAYEPGERDMLIMQHEFVAEYPERKEAITSTMIDFGIPFGDTSMSRTVGLPAAIASRMILQGEISGISGVHRPLIPEIYEPVLAELEQLGISLEEKVEVMEA
jgi:saccharopine dehydrogenase-like NADP-dependent oxidoreductase